MPPAPSPPPPSGLRPRSGLRLVCFAAALVVAGGAVAGLALSGAEQASAVTPVEGSPRASEAGQGPPGARVAPVESVGTPASGLIPVSQGTAQEAADEDAQRAAPVGKGVWAVVVGIDDYPGERYDLRAGIADARDVDAALARRGVPESQRTLLLGDDADGASLRAALDWLVAHAGPESTAVVFYSGHVREVTGDRDGDGEAVDEALFLADGTEVIDGELAATLDGLAARRTWLAIAGCFGGGFDEAVGPGGLLTAAAPEGELAYENDDLGRSYLVEYVVRRPLLEGDAASVQEAFARGSAQLRRDHPDRLPVVLDRLGEPLRLGPPFVPSL